MNARDDDDDDMTREVDLAIQENRTSLNVVIDDISTVQRRRGT